MYSLVLAAMVTAGTASPSWGCHSCSGYSAWGGGAASGYGGASGGGYAFGGGNFSNWGCFGCYGSIAYGYEYPAGLWAHSYGSYGYAGNSGSADRQNNYGGSGARAKVNLKVPSQAQVFVNGHLINVSGDTNRMTTPELSPGRDYYYTFRAEIIRNGRKQTGSKLVVVRAGEETNVDFSQLEYAQAAKEETYTAR